MRGLEPRNIAGFLLYFHHLEIVLAGAAFRAGPVDGDVLPARAGGDAFVGRAGRLVVDEAADQAHPRLELHLSVGHGIAGSKIRPDINPWRSRPRSFSPSPLPTRPAGPACRPTC